MAHPRSASVIVATLWAVGALSCASAPSHGAPPLPPAANPAPSRPAPEPAAAPAAESGGLAFDVTPSDAEVIVDGRPQGKIAALRGGFLPLAPGLYQVTIARPGFATWRAEVSVRSTVEPLRVALPPRRPTP